MDAMLAMACIEPEPLPPLPQFKTTSREEFQYLGLSLSKYAAKSAFLPVQPLCAAFVVAEAVEPYHEPYPVHERKHKGAQHLF